MSTIRKNKEHQFWLINKSTKKDVSIADLRITIRRGQRINLLGNKYNFTLDQLQQSSESGSIYKKRHLLSVQDVKPVSLYKHQVVETVKPRLLVPLRNPTQDIGTPYMEDLDDVFDDMTEEQFAAEQADADAMDRAPVLPVDKKYKDNSGESDE